MNTGDKSEKIFVVQLQYSTLTGRLYIAEYGNGSMAVQILDNDGPETISVNLEAQGDVPQPGYFYVRNYGEWEGLADALESAGIAAKVSPVRIGYGTGALMKLNETITAQR